MKVAECLARQFSFICPNVGVILSDECQHVFIIIEESSSLILGGYQLPRSFHSL